VKYASSALCGMGLAVIAAVAAAQDAPSVNPLAGNAEAIAAGESLFASMNCDGCHGGGGSGWVGPSLADGRWRFGGNDAALYHSIAQGRPRGMPAYGELLPEESIWQLVSYLQQLRAPPGVPTQYWP
jgi:cytochrome c oxidase cbb3-type subunit 3